MSHLVWVLMLIDIFDFRLEIYEEKLLLIRYFSSVNRYFYLKITLPRIISNL